MVPARSGSERFPGKNHILMPYLWASLPNAIKYHTVFSTNDRELLRESPEQVKGLVRHDDLCTPTTSMKDVIAYVADWEDLDDSDRIVTLYPTYIDRTWEDIIKIRKWAVDNDYPNVLCADPLDGVSVHKCFYEEPGYQGRPVIEHDLYRGQDYPKAFEASCFVVVTRVDHIPKLNNLLWSPETFFFPLDRRRPDIDTLADFRKWVASCT
jgi:CMP-N-acetylneuraminic acid synthetase